VAARGLSRRQARDRSRGHRFAWTSRPGRGVGAPKASDRWDGRVYRRALSLGGEAVALSVTQSGPRNAPLLTVTLSGGLDQRVDAAAWLEDSSHFARVDNPNQLAPMLSDCLTR